MMTRRRGRGVDETPTPVVVGDRIDAAATDLNASRFSTTIRVVAAAASTRPRRRRDQFIEFIKKLLQPSFVLDALPATARDRVGTNQEGRASVEPVDTTGRAWQSN